MSHNISKGDLVSLKDGHMYKVHRIKPDGKFTGKRVSDTRYTAEFDVKDVTNLFKEVELTMEAAIEHGEYFTPCYTDDNRFKVEDY